MKNWTTIIKQSETILTRIFKENSAFLIFHDDADGCCAAAILLYSVSKQTTHKPPDFSSPEKHSVELTSRLLKKLREKRPRFMVSVDLALTQSVAKIENLLNSLDAHMLIYDHHAQSKALQWSERCIHLNPLNFNLGNVPASYYSYVLYKHYTKKEDACWAAAVGVIADYRTEECRDLLEEVKNHHPSLYPFETIDQPTALCSPLMTMAHLLNAGYQHSDCSGAKIAVEALNEALEQGDPTLLLEGKTEKATLLHSFRKEVDEELKECLEKFRFEAEFTLNSRLAFYSINPKFNITSQIATQLQHSHPKTIIAIISPETQKTLKISLRRGNRIDTDLSVLAELTTSELEHAFGGGHKDAAGCILRNEDLDHWKKSMLQYLYKKPQ